MEMMRWLVGNRIVQVAWGLGLLAVLLSWIFGGKNADHGSAVADSHAKVEQVVEANATKEASSNTEAVAEVKQDVESTKAEASAAVATGASVATAAAVAVVDSAEAATEEAAKEVVSDTSDVTDTASEASVEVVSTEAAESTAGKTEVVAGTAVQAVAEVVESAEAAVVKGLAEKSNEDLLMMAREAFWNNGLDEAVEFYQVLIEREPSVIEHKGELGNVFWRQGFPRKAAELYAEIAEPMIEQGNGERVANMVGFIGLFFPERAAKIRVLLDK
ncbi:MAG: hypothetical protein CSB47_06045 [Proteobacteria bacterium]|nr:MAG: hypothetical protein CSB47_06045 [Pseudomonadota bacterium]